MLRAQVHLQERQLPEAEASIRAAMLQSLQLWWGLPVPGAAKQVCMHSVTVMLLRHASSNPGLPVNCCHSRTATSPGSLLHVWA